MMITVEGSIWSSEYVPDTPILLARAADSYPNGGRQGFLAWLKDRCTITHIESIEHHHGVDAVWRKFSSVFTILGTIIFYEPIFRLFMRRMMQQLLADGVRWVDLRLAFTFFYYREGQETQRRRTIICSRSLGKKWRNLRLPKKAKISGEHE